MNDCYRALKYFYLKYKKDKLFIVGDCYCYFSTVKEDNIHFDIENSMFFKETSQDLIFCYVSIEECKFCIKENVDIIDFPNFELFDIRNKDISLDKNFEETLIKFYKASKLKDKLDKNLGKKIDSSVVKPSKI